MSGLPTFTDVIVDLEVLLSIPHTQEKWVDGLSKYHEHILTSGEWINDKLVNAAQKPNTSSSSTHLWLSKHISRPDIGFQMTSEFVQVLHTGCGHWVAMSTIACKLGEVNVYDSMRPALTESLKRQISAILCLPIQKKEVILEYEHLHCYLLLILLFTYVGIVIVNHKLDHLIVGCLLLHLSKF